jgi:hypothetical protein
MSRRDLLGALVAITCVAGAACARSEAGGALPEREAAQVAPEAGACPPRVWAGDYVVQSQDELDALAAYAMVTGSVIIMRTDLAELQGPPCLRFIGGTLEIRINMNLTRISGFTGLRHIGGDLYISNNHFRVDVQGFDSLRTIAGDMGLNDIHEMRGFDRLERVGGRVRFRFGELALQGMGRLRTVGALGFAEMDSVNVEGLTALETVIDRMHITESGPIISTAGMRNLSAIGGDVYFFMRVGPDSLAGFRVLDTIGGGLLLEITEGPAELDGFPALEAIGGSLSLDHGPDIERIRAFAALRSVGRLDVSGMSALIELTGFGALESITGDLIVSSNSSLERVALAALASVGGNLAIQNNPVLNDLRLPELSFLGGSLTITGNPGLPTCQAQALVDELRAHGYGFTATVVDNAPDECAGKRVPRLLAPLR